jgi:hypothetical protein
VVLVASRARASAAGIATGATGAVAAWAVHVGFDWDWEMPAVTLPVLLLIGALIAASESGSRGSRPAAERH